MDPWLLPENIADALPIEARTVERLRRALLDCYRSYGYELVVPPLLEHIESLQTGSGGDLDLMTIKTVDQLSGRTVGLRADTTPQVARIDSHILNRDGVVRLCYAGSTLRARPPHPMASREPVQVGAEIYGAACLDADIEALELAVASARILGFADVQIDLGHTGVVRALLADVIGIGPDGNRDSKMVSARDSAHATALGPSLGPSLGSALGPALGSTLDPVRSGEEEVEDVLCALGAKDAIALDAACRRLQGRLSADALRGLHALLECHGGREVLAHARRILPGSGSGSGSVSTAAPLRAALDDLARLVDACPTDRIGIDLADLHGFRYHTGATFAAYVPGVNGAVLRGGRYDDIGRAYGRARPATGFSIVDLREAAQAHAASRAPTERAIRAPWRGADARLEERIQTLRAQGEIVVRGAAPKTVEESAGLSGSASAAAAVPAAVPAILPMGAALVVDRELVYRHGIWDIVEIDLGT